MNPKSVAWPLPQLILLLGAAVSVMLAGSEDSWAIVAFLCAGALAMLLLRPAVRPPMLPLVLLALFCLLGLMAFLPQEYFAVPAWRRLLAGAGGVPLGDSVNPQPWLGWFWWWLLAGTCAVLAALLTAPSQPRQIALVLHVAALFVAVYSSLAIFAWQTGWKYPFAGGAPFGFLPNKNHTATLLFVGAIISFGLMQWEVARGRKAAAVLAAFCGAPPLAALLFFSNSRAGVVFLAVGLLIWAAGAGRSGSRKIILAGAGILAAFLLILLLAGGSEVRNRLSVLLSDAVSVRGEGVDAPKDLDFRQPIFRDTFAMVADQLWTGVGLGQFKYVFPQYRDESSRAAVILHPESDWLMVAAESGAPAAAALFLLVGWYAVQSWRGRHGDDGLLRWTAASAVLAAVAHGIIDVPWHRVSLGWFLSVIAVVCVPRNLEPLGRPAFLRIITVLLGLALLVSGCFMARGLWQGRPPLPYRWKEYNRVLTKLGGEMAWEEGLAKIAEAIAIYPLERDAHYWMLAFTDAKDAQLEGIIRSGRAVEPVLPQVAEGQAGLWRGIDASREGEAWAEAVRRSLRIDLLQADRGAAGTRGIIDRAVQSLRGNVAAQMDLLGQIGSVPGLQAQWFCSASPEAAEMWMASQSDAARWLDGLSPEVRGQVLDRWITLPSAAGAAAYMEARNGPAPGAYWRQLAGHYANAGNKARAVGMVADAAGLELDGRVPDGAFARELAALRGQGNEVAVRRLVREAVEAKEAEVEKLRVAMAAYAAAGDWEMAWRAASRLVTTAKNGH